MPDIIANGDFGRDDGVKCDRAVMVYSALAQKKVPRICGGKTFLTDDQGGGSAAMNAKVAVSPSECSMTPMTTNSSPKGGKSRCGKRPLAKLKGDHEHEANELKL